jgi:SAM-dependent methyltransferase
MQLATGANMLNFGYWVDDVKTPIEAQSKLCMMVGRISELDSSKSLVDVGSGFAAPAVFWKNVFNPQIFCVNINCQQLATSSRAVCRSENPSAISNQCEVNGISFINSSSLALPFANHSIDRVISLESAQHFKPLSMFIEESWKILKFNGLLVIAIPVTVISEDPIKMLLKLGILALTWSSQHYRLDYVKSIITKQGFKIIGIDIIGPRVYDPLAEYYFKNRKLLRERILTQYPSYVENILYRSMVKMRNTSKKRIIDYVVIKARKT